MAPLESVKEKGSEVLQHITNTSQMVTISSIVKNYSFVV